MLRPYYEHAGITIYHGDCQEILPTLRADLVLTDPPYGLGFAPWDEAIPDGWLEFARAAAPCVAFTTAPTTMWDYPRPDWIACWTRAGATTRTAQGGFNHWSPVLVYGSHRLPTDLCQLPDCANEKARGTRNGHPTPKPIALMKWLLARLPGGLVLDPFAGSGTTLVAARDMGRRAIGIEIEERYCEIAAKRLAQEVFSFPEAAPC